MPTFTIIIPHKNIPNLLVRCLNSIPVREDIQVIVVDDGSAEGGNYPHQYEQLSRPFLEYYHYDQHMNAGHARNVGLEHARGEWILFADADDFFVDGFYDTICKYKDAEEDLIIFTPKAVMSDNIAVTSQRNHYITKRFDSYRRKVISSREAALRIPAPWSKMIKHSLIVKNTIRFDRIRAYEDDMFSTQLACFAKNILLLDDVIYTVTERENSVTSSMEKGASSILFWLDVRIRVNHYLIDHGYSPQTLIPIFDIALRNGWLTFVKASIKAARNGMLFIGTSDIFRPKDKRKWI